MERNPVSLGDRKIHGLYDAHNDPRIRRLANSLSRIFRGGRDPESILSSDMGEPVVLEPEPPISEEDGIAAVGEADVAEGSPYHKREK